MKVEATSLDGVLKITPVRHSDDRGWFSEVWNRSAMVAAGVDIDFVQDNESLSASKGTLRGIHFQTAPHAQDKLVRAVNGRILDVAVDLRRSSPAFGKYVAVELSAENGVQLLVPKGFGHAFLTLEPDCHVAYKASAPYNASADAVISFADPAIGVDWQIDVANAIVSTKDRDAVTLAEAAHLLFE